MSLGPAYSTQGKSSPTFFMGLAVSGTAPHPYSSSMQTEACPPSSAPFHGPNLRIIKPSYVGITLLIRPSLSSSNKKWGTCAGMECSSSSHIPSSGISHSYECHRLDAYLNTSADPELLMIIHFPASILTHAIWHPPKAIHWVCILHCLIWHIYSSDRHQGLVLLSKTDLYDGFYQFHITPLVDLSLATPFLNLPGGAPLGNLQPSPPSPRLW